MVITVEQMDRRCTVRRVAVQTGSNAKLGILDLLNLVREKSDKDTKEVQ